MPFIDIPGVPTEKLNGWTLHKTLNLKISCSPLRKSKEPVSSNFFSKLVPPPQPKQMPFINIPGGGVPTLKNADRVDLATTRTLNLKKIFHVHHSANQRNLFQATFSKLVPPSSTKTNAFHKHTWGGGYQLWKMQTRWTLLPPGHWT